MRVSAKTVRIISAVIAGILVFTLIFSFVADIAINSMADAATTVSSLNNKLDSLANQKSKIQKELKNIEKKKQSTIQNRKKFLD